MSQNTDEPNGSNNNNDVAHDEQFRGNSSSAMFVSWGVIILILFHRSTETCDVALDSESAQMNEDQFDNCVDSADADCESHNNQQQMTQNTIISNKATKKLYKELSRQWGFTCQMSENCRCMDCQGQYFDCDYQGYQEVSRNQSRQYLMLPI